MIGESIEVGRPIRCLMQQQMRMGVVEMENPGRLGVWDVEGRVVFAAGMAVFES